jgi:hypothetical protein
LVGRSYADGQGRSVILPRDSWSEGAVIVGNAGVEKRLPLEQARNFSVFQGERICAYTELPQSGCIVPIVIATVSDSWPLVQQPLITID